MRAAIIAAALGATLLAAGCGIAMRWGYDHAAWLTYRWLDGFVGFDDAQSRRVRSGLDAFFAWHRKTQLDDYAELLARARADVLVDTTPDRICAWNERLQQRVQPLVEQALPLLLEVAPSLTEAQLARIEAKNAERNEEYRRDFLQAEPERSRRAAERAIERTEELYGRLQPAQRAWMEQQLARTPANAETGYAERLARQADTLATLRRLREPGTSREAAEAAVRELATRLRRDADPAYAQRVRSWNCQVASELHNRLTAGQRRHAARKLKQWEDDLRILVNGDKPAPPLAAAEGPGPWFAGAGAGPRESAQRGALPSSGTATDVFTACGKSFIAAAYIAGSMRPMSDQLPSLCARVS